MASVWLPQQNQIVTVPLSSLWSLDSTSTPSLDEILYRASASRIAETL